MGKYIKVACSFFLAVFIIACVSQESVFAKSGIKVMVYGASIQGEHSPMMKNNTVLIPFKGIFTKMGFTVNYDPASKTISGEKAGTTIKLVINQNTAWINAAPTTLQVAPQIIDGVTFVPLRLIGEASGLEVKWYGNSQVVSLYGKQNLFPVANGGKFGYMDAEGQIVIDYQTKFTDAYAFNEGLAIVYANAKFDGFINQQGYKVIPKGNYYDAKDFSEGLAAYRTLDTTSNYAISNYGYMDLTGTSVIQPQFKRANKFSEGLAAVQVGSKYGYINSTGKLVIKAQYDSAKDFYEGTALVTIDGISRYIDNKGEFLFNANYSNGESFSEGVAAVRAGTKVGFMDHKGKLVIPAIYEEAHSFSEGAAVVKVNGKSGYIDTKGKLIIPYQFDAAGDFSEGLAAVESGGKTGFINKTGAWVIQPTFAWAHNFKNGLSYAYSSDDEEEVYLNKKGQIVWMKNQNIKTK
ncbi:WG repeat-containing protein [Paenibacillus tritici]|uniref:WG repeat-containing protein n=1 Tax=Paenibacillus tritici TaxID=1873425 RepID=A0ABX2DQW2_9BACL|nr:WG repeat-containing protein [Paenibacillus tritici]NQX47053.1 WG repeat-containing protein [Paenibacillus tritici]